MRRALVAMTVCLAVGACASEERGRLAMAAGAPPAATASAPESAGEEQRMDAEQQAGLEAWRSKRLERLTAPDGWLALVGLEWLEEGDNRLGSAADAGVRFPARAPATVGTIRRHGEELTLTPAPGVALTAGGKTIDGPVRLASDADGEPTVVELGAISFYVIHRGDRWAVRIKDSESPVRTGFSGLDYYPPRQDWRVEARFEPAPAGRTIGVPNILGTVEEAPSQGDVVFSREGHEVRLQAIDEGDGQLFLVFGDATNGKSTYGGGRFVYADPPPPGERTVIVDFNRAYNPPCVFTPYATCPLPPRGNKLPMPVEAGEKLWSGYHHPG